MQDDSALDHSSKFRAFLAGLQNTAKDSHVKAVGNFPPFKKRKIGQWLKIHYKPTVVHVATG